VPYTVRISPAADRELRKLDRPIQERIFARLDELQNEPRPKGVEKLAGSSEPRYRVRAGNYRIIYRVDDQVLTVLVLKVGDRKEVYRNL
jgi:mRNA interferase RelE/StbE